MVFVVYPWIFPIILLVTTLRTEEMLLERQLES